MKRVVLLTVLLFEICFSVGAEYRIASNLPYSDIKDAYASARCVLDIYYNPDMSDMPVVVWFHGGGLTGGCKEIPEELKNSGCVVVAPNYRLMPDVEVAACIDDAAAAVAWTFRNIERYGGNPSAIFVAGHSAGGYLTSMIGLDRKWLRKYGVESDSIAALVPFSGQAITHFAQRKLTGVPELQPVVDEYAPLFHVRKDAPPYVIITGDSELELYGRYEENLYLWRMLKLVGHPCVSIYKLDGHDHGNMVHPAHTILKNVIRRMTTERR